MIIELTVGSRSAAQKCDPQNPNPYVMKACFFSEEKGRLLSFLP